MATLLNKAKTKTHTHEGGKAARFTPMQELERAVLSCFLWEGQFYESGESIADRISELVKQCKPSEVCFLAKRARTEMNLRHVPLLLIAELVRNGKTFSPDHPRAISEVIQRPDDMCELLAIYRRDDERATIPNKLRKGLARAFGEFDEYQLAKYNRKNKKITLRTILNLTRPRPKDQYEADMWGRLLRDELKTPDTWEVELSASTDKKASWERLLAEGKLGGLALLRNLRNMTEAGVSHHSIGGQIRAAKYNGKFRRVLPYRFIAAARHAPRFEPELEEAMLESLRETPTKFEGTTTFVVDVSGSMFFDNMSAKSDLRRIDAACGLAMVLRELCRDVQVFTFSNEIVEVPPRSGFALRDAIVESQSHGGTDLIGALNELPNLVSGVDRLIVLTDEQFSLSFAHRYTTNSIPKNTVGAQYPWMINVASYDRGVAHGSDWIKVSGFSEAISRYMHEYECRFVK